MAFSHWRFRVGRKLLLLTFFSMWHFIKVLADNNLGRQHLMYIICTIMDTHDAHTDMYNECTRTPNTHRYLDDLSAQKIESFTNIALEAGILPFPIPPGLTDLLQPVDNHVGARTKAIIAALYKVEVEVNFQEWRGYQSNGSLSAGMRRRHMARWLALAWEWLKANPYIIHQSFVHTVLVKLDGTHELVYRGLENYEVPLHT